MKRAGIDHCRYVITFLDARPGPEPADHDRLVFADADRLLRSLAARVLRELAGLVRLGVRSLDGEVRHDLRAEGLPQLEPAVQHAVLRGAGLERCVLEVLGPDP